MLGRHYAKYDIWLSPTTARVAEPWGKYSLSRQATPSADGASDIFREPIQYTVPHNIMGTPAMSLPLAMHSTGVPVGVQIAGRPAAEHLVLQLATALEEAMPWRDRVPPLHVARLTAP
jgi:amidase